MLEAAFCEFKSHEQIENFYILDKLQERLRSKNLVDNSVCGCHKDNRLLEMLELVHRGYSYANRSAETRNLFCNKLLTELQDFTATFIPHMEEEEEVFQPLLMQNFDYNELKMLKESVIQEHLTWKENLFSTGSSLSHLESLFLAISDLGEMREIQCKEIVPDEIDATPSVVELLPPEVLMNIFVHLSPPDRGNCAKVCRRWNDVIYTPRLWPQVYITSWAHGSWVYSGVDCERYLNEVYNPPFPIEFSLGDDSDDDFEHDMIIASKKLIEYKFLESSFIDSILPGFLGTIGTGIKKLSLACCKGLGNSQLNNILTLTINLNYLDLSYTDISDGAFKNLRIKGGCSQLTHLILDGCDRLTDTGLERLGACFTTVVTCGSSKDGNCCSKKRKLEPSLKLSTGLIHLSLSGCSKVTDYGIKTLLRVTLDRGSLRYLDISGCLNVSAGILRQVIHYSPNLKPEFLFYCNLVIDGPYEAEANGCQNLGCKFRSCCCLE
ncbi:hypothetical protein QYM36_003616 [Artemia franciscana]|uniref:F-box domain-containing protein n=2 Tax=Artemia franciscana TaxID=6661 RepID=A0AA88I6V4_ARTSF|nr:hypothetical protein QYM36_003616 [Artemia franciscana]KAK2721390.1 hypothetical protein QYM36_003616 [Artemia franciscana]